MTDPHTQERNSTMSKKKAADARKGKMVSHESVVLALRKVSKVKEIITLADKLGVTINARHSLDGAPNVGVLKMRAANIIRGALKRAGRFDGELYRIPRAKKVR